MCCVRRNLRLLLLPILAAAAQLDNNNDGQRHQDRNDCDERNEHACIDPAAVVVCGLVILAGRYQPFIRRSACDGRTFAGVGRFSRVGKGAACGPASRRGGHIGFS